MSLSRFGKQPSENMRADWFKGRLSITQQKHRTSTRCGHDDGAREFTF